MENLQVYQKSLGFTWGVFRSTPSWAQALTPKSYVPVFVVRGANPLDLFPFLFALLAQELYWKKDGKKNPQVEAMAKYCLTNHSLARIESLKIYI